MLLPILFVYKLNSSAKSIVLFHHLELIRNTLFDAIFLEGSIWHIKSILLATYKQNYGSLCGVIHINFIDKYQSYIIIIIETLFVAFSVPNRVLSVLHVFIECLVYYCIIGNLGLWLSYIILIMIPWNWYYYCIITRILLVRTQVSEKLITLFNITHHPCILNCVCRYVGIDFISSIHIYFLLQMYYNHSVPCTCVFYSETIYWFQERCIKIEYCFNFSNENNQSFSKFAVISVMVVV